MPGQLIDKGAGWHVVMDGDRKIAGPSRDRAAMEKAAEDYRPEADPAIKSERDWSRKLDAQLREARSAISAEFMALLVKHFDEDTAVMMMRSIDPILVAGKEGRRRERMRFSRPLPAKATAA